MIKEGNVVKEMMLGNTKVKICDDYCRDKTKEDVEKILKDIAMIVRNSIVQRNKGGDGESEV